MFPSFTNKGRVFRLNAYEIPEGKRQAKGTAIVNLLQLGPNEKIATLLAIDEKDENKYLLLATKNGIVKKFSCSYLSSIFIYICSFSKSIFTNY